MKARVSEQLMGYPIVGFSKFHQLPIMDYPKYRLFYVTKVTIHGYNFYLFDQ